MNHKILFIDETGKHSYNHVSKYFILSACAITTDHLAEIRNKANNIIFKYWGSNRSFKRKFKRHNITFRAKEIFDCKGPFQILKDVKVKRTFWKDVYGELLSRMDITYFMTLVDKLEFKKNYPKLSDAEILSKSYEELLKSFLNFLIKSKIQGEIVAESSADQDQALVRSLSFFQRNSFTLYKNKTLVNEKVTSLSLINKN